MIEAINRFSSAVRGAGGASTAAAGSQVSAATERLEANAVSFQNVLAGLANHLSESVKGAEASSIAGINGTVPVQQVVESVMGAEQSLHTAIAVRDKVVAAYLEIGRMAI